MVATVAEGERDVEKFVFAVVRGDMEVNETKLANAVGAKALRPAREDEIRAIGAEPGYGSPVGVHGAIVVVDDAVATSPNLVAGANEEGYHLLNVNYGRDFQGDIVTDIAAAQEGDACVQCGEALRLVGGVEVGNIFKLGTRYSEAMGCTFLDSRWHVEARCNGVVRDRGGAAAGVHRRGVQRRARPDVADHRRAVRGAVGVAGEGR